MSAQLYNIGPDAIADPGVAGGPGFTLSRPEWIAIQAYSTDALALPTTADAFRKSLGAGAPKDLSDFDKLIEAYVAVNQHVTTWTTKTFPASVALASDVYQYGTVKAPVYYPRILDEAKILERNPGDEQAKAALKAMLDSLKRDADEKSAKAGEVSKAVGTFASESELDKVTLVGSDGKGGLVSYYDKKYGSTSADVEKLTKDIAEQKGILKTANDEYDHNVVVAATSPTYAWVWPLGTIAAAVVAGIYGKRATDALDKARAAQAKIDLLSDKLAADANLLVAIHNAEAGTGNIVRGLTEALPVIQKIQGVWGGIASDLGAISALIDDDIRNVPPIIMGLGIEEALKSWSQVAAQADTYRAHAFIKNAPGQLSMAAWKLANQVSSVRTVSQHVMAA